MKTIQRFPPICIICLIALCLALSACGGSVSGKVFVDEDGDGVLSGDEKGVPYAQISVTRDDKEIARHYSDVNGLFNISIKTQPGKVCLTTDLSYSEANLDYIRYSLNNDSVPAAMKVSPPKAMTSMKATTTSDDNDNDGVLDVADNCPDVANANQLDEDDDGTGDACEEDASDSTDDENSGSTDGTSVTAETPDNETTANQGWSGDQYCRNIKSKGFEVDIPVAMDHAAAIADLPERLTVNCPAGAECEVVIAVPDGCTLNTIYLPEGLSPASLSQPGMSFDGSMNSVSFNESAGELASKAFKAMETSRPTLSVSDFRLVTIKLKANDDVDIGVLERSIKPSAECTGQSLELPDVPIEITRDFVLSAYWHLEPVGITLVDGQAVTLTAGIENQGKSTVSYGDVTIIPPAGSVITEVPPGCLNNVTQVICRVEKIKGKTFGTQTIKFKLPELDSSIPAGETENLTMTVKFFAPGMDKSLEESHDIVVKQQ